MLSGFLTFQISVPTFAQTSGVNPSYGMPSGMISYNAGVYSFYSINGTKLYDYTINTGNTNNGGTFNVLRAYSTNGTYFLPSNYGGISMIFDTDTLTPWDSRVSYTRETIIGDTSNHKLNGDSLVVYWRMIQTGTSNYIKYKYIFKIIGRTLSIHVVVDDAYKNYAANIQMDRSQGANAYAIAVPYLPTFFILLSNDIYTSFFADWNRSNASQAICWDGSRYIHDTQNSLRYSQIMFYHRKTNGQRNQLDETLYLTISSNIEEVFPNIPNPISTFKDLSVNSILWDYRCTPDQLTNISKTGHMDKLYQAGLRNIWLQIHNWQAGEYDRNLPCVLGTVVDNDLKTAIDTARLGYNFRVGLHQNYVDCYPNSASCAVSSSSSYVYNDSRIALNSNGEKITAYKNGWGEQSYLLKPSLTYSFLDYWSSQIESKYPNINASYLDVHSSVLPITNYVDYDASIPDAGKFIATINSYRSLYDRLRYNNNGPVQGEGGAQIFYQGYVDDMDARIMIPPFQYSYSMNYPIFINFDLKKLREKAFLHGVGWYPIFYAADKGKDIDGNITKNIVLKYIASELAYGHGAYLPLNDRFSSWDDFLECAQLEYNHVFSVQKDYANATPISIQYYDGSISLKTASEYIKAHPENYDNITSDEFMGRVRVEYDNGVIVYVNRHPSSIWPVSVGNAGGWFNYNINGTPVIGTRTSTSFTLPANNGWVVYDPLKNSATSISISGPSEINHPIQSTDPNITYTWRAVVTGVTSPVTYTWKQNGTVVGTGPIFTKTLTYIGSYSPYTFQLTLEIQDASVPVKSLVSSKTVTVGLILKENAAENNLPKEFSLQQNYPNPFNPITEIKYSLPQAGKVSLIIYDILGREVTTLVNQIQEPGYYSATFNGSNYASGVYIARIIVNSADKQAYIKTIKMLMAK